MKAMKQIYSLILGAAILTAGLAGCSDNYDTALEPVRTDKTLTVDVLSADWSGGRLSLGAAPSETEVRVGSNTRWVVEVTDCDGGWCEVDAFSGVAGGSFTISVRDNMKETRRCYVKVWMVDAQGNRETSGSREITVIQEASDVRLSPSSAEPFPAENPGSKEFEVIANVEWSLALTYETGVTEGFVTVTPLSGTMTETAPGVFAGDGNAHFTVSLPSNRTAADRAAYLTLTSAIGSYSVRISQLGSDYTFDVSPSEDRLVPAEGEAVAFGVLSLSDWSAVTAADWIVLTPDSGTGADGRTETVATILPNTTASERRGVIRFIPSDANYREVSVTVIQAPSEGLREPAVSIPWLENGYTQTEATVGFRYYSPFAEVTGAGLEWRRESDSVWTRTPSSATGTHEGFVSVSLTGLDPATRYVARGYVEYEGKVIYGSVSLPFTTAGRRPANEDNPVPGV